VPIAVPVLNLTGWFDLFLRGGLDLHSMLEQTSEPAVRAEHRLVVGPWEHVSHLNLTPSAAGQWEFGPEAISGPRSWAGLTFQFFDRWLRGARTALAETAPVRYFVMGDNRWRDAESWPPAGRPVRLYLRGGGRANSRFGDGVLAPEPPGAEPSDSYVYDPDDPVPSVGGRTLFYHPSLGPAGVLDQARVEERQDVLVYTSARLVRPLTIAGPVSVTLFAASSAVDTDFTAKLVDVQPDGYCANLADGIVRARYRHTLEREALLEPGEVAEYRIDLWSVAHRFAVGHRLRLEITSSNFPKYDRNLNARANPAHATAADLRVATQQVFHDGARPSHLTLPEIEP
jgi:putative CocE/NonD family hydrolase